MHLTTAHRLLAGGNALTAAALTTWIALAGVSWVMLSRDTGYAMAFLAGAAFIAVGQQVRARISGGR